MSIIIKSGSSANTAEINDAGRLQTCANLVGVDGSPASVSPMGSLNVSPDPTVIFFEAGDAALDATSKWNVLGTVSPAVGSSNVLVNPGTGANASSVLSSMPLFTVNTAITVGAKLAFETGAPTTGNHRFFGLGTSPTTPGTATAPLQDAIGFEVDLTGTLRASVYASGVRVFSQALSMPTDGLQHLFAIMTRGDVTFFYLDTFTSPLAYTQTGPSIQSLPLRVASLNNTVTTTGTPTMSMAGLVLYDAARPALQIADAANPWRRAQVGRSGGLSVKGAPFTPAVNSFAAGVTGATTIVDVSEAGNVTFIIKNTVAGTAYTGAPVIQLEQSDDGVSWAALLGSRSDTGTTTSVVTPTGGANTSVAVDCALEGIAYVRARVTTGTATGGMTIVAQPGGLAFSPAVSLIQPVRTNIAISGTTLAVGANGAEALLTLTRSSGLAVGSAATSFAVSFGHRFRMTSLVLSQVGNLTTATSAATTFRFRVNTAGAVTTSSPVILAARVATIAQTGHYQAVSLGIPDGWEMAGDGVGTFGISVNSIYVTNSPTVDVMITGYEY